MISLILILLHRLTATTIQEDVIENLFEFEFKIDGVLFLGVFGIHLILKRFWLSLWQPITNWKTFSVYDDRSISPDKSELFCSFPGSFFFRRIPRIVFPQCPTLTLSLIRGSSSMYYTDEKEEKVKKTFRLNCNILSKYFLRVI
jgi:hypothetical protein